MKKNKKVIFILPIALLLIIAIISNFYTKSNQKKSEVNYKYFLEMVSSDRVSDVYLNNNEMIKVKLKDNSIVYTTNPRSLSFKEALLTKGINVHEGGEVNPLEAVPLTILLVFIFVMAYYYAAKGSKSKAGAFKLSSIDAAPEKDTGITFENIAGNEEVKDSIKELVDFIKNPEKYSKYNVRMPRGVILYGPPGTGKTLMAKALANEAGVPFFAVNGSDFVQIYVGVGAGRIRDLFKKAREKGKAVIFIDEIDAIGKKRNGKADGGSDERDQTLNALLAEMSGFKENQGIVVMAATNRLDVLDEALLRPGRFDRHIEVGLPDIKARYQILRLHGQKKPLSKDVDLQKIAQMTVYFSGAKLENLMNEAALLAAREESEFITMEDIDKAYGIVVAGAEKKDRSYIKDLDRKITAYHEAGHALVSRLVSPENLVRKITIIPSTKGAGGYTLNIPPDSMYSTRTQLLNRIKVGLGGRAAEEIIFGKENITTGAYGDIQNVTQTIISMIKYYGMFENSGLLNYDVLINEGISNQGEIVKLANDTVAALYEEVKGLLLSENDKLQKIADALLEYETIYDKHLDEIIAV